MALEVGGFYKGLRQILVTRRASKARILSEGGEQALSHAPHDLTRIDHAILRLDAGTYGTCVDCGDLIEESRLDAIPETPFCAGCAHERATKS